MRLPAALLCACGLLHAQAVKNYAFHLDNGASVLYQTYSQVELTDQARMFGTAQASGNTIRRTMTDGSNQTWLGFALRIDREPGEPIRFRISMVPLDMWGFFNQSAPPREIRNGDRVLLDVLAEPGTGRRIYDTFQVGTGVDMQNMPMAKTIPLVPGAGAAIRFQSPKLLEGAVSLSTNGPADNGSAISLRIPGRGRFSFSPRPEPGFRMEAIAEGNRLMFLAGNASYSVECSGAIVDGPGAWYLWVRYEPAIDPK